MSILIQLLASTGCRIPFDRQVVSPHRHPMPSSMRTWKCLLSWPPRAKCRQSVQIIMCPHLRLWAASELTRSDSTYKTKKHKDHSQIDTHSCCIVLILSMPVFMHLLLLAQPGKTLTNASQKLIKLTPDCSLSLLHLWT